MVPTPDAANGTQRVFSDSETLSVNLICQCHSSSSRQSRHFDFIKAVIGNEFLNISIPICWVEESSFGNSNCALTCSNYFSELCKLDNLVSEQYFAG